MSRGPGIWQRAIMTALQTRDVIYLRDVLPSPYTTAQRLACVRAAHQLAHGRKINLYTVVDPACWTDSVVGYNLSRDRRSHDGTTAKIHRKIQDRGCP
jgi:hypothetical protein